MELKGTKLLNRTLTNHPKKHHFKNPDNDINYGTYEWRVIENLRLKKRYKYNHLYLITLRQKQSKVIKNSLVKLMHKCSYTKG